jgi:transcriptional regulator with XRE-family HTH domain
MERNDMERNKLPERLRLLRREKAMTQAGLAAALHLLRVTYTHYELGKRTPDLDTLLQIAAFHQVSIDFLLGATWLRPTLERYLAGAAQDSASAVSPGNSASLSLRYPTLDEDDPSTGRFLADEPDTP